VRLTTSTNFCFRRPTLRETQRLVENFHVAAHSNHMCWYPDMILDAYKQYRPDWHKALMKIKDAMDKPGENEAIEEIYATMEKGPTERSHHARDEQRWRHGDTIAL